MGDDGLVQVEIVEHGLTLTELVDRVERLTTDRDPWLIVLDAFGVAANVAAQLDKRGVRLHRVSGSEHAEASGCSWTR
jgi:hypothetical protein